jgi:signal transduction histidine kinase
LWLCRIARLHLRGRPQQGDLWLTGRRGHELLNAQLERGVDERTAELMRANAELERRIEERTRERETAWAQVQQMQKLVSVGQLTGGIAHDINNLLLVIGGNLEILSQRLPDDVDIKSRLARAVEDLDRGRTLTERLLAFARPSRIRQPARSSHADTLI